MILHSDLNLQVDEFNKPGRVLTTDMLTSITRSVKARLKE